MAEGEKEKQIMAKHGKHDTSKKAELQIKGGKIIKKGK